MRDSKVYKVLRIIFLALAIMSLVFALMKKVGLAASESTSAYPLPYDFDLNLIPKDHQSECDWLRNNGMLPSDCNVLVLSYENASNYSIVVYVPILGSANSVVLPTTYSSYNDSYVFDFSRQAIGTQGYYYKYNNNGWIDSWSGTVNLQPIMSLWLDGGLIKSGFKSLYPVYSTIPIRFSDDSLAFGVSEGGFDSPGWNDAFDEWVEDDINPVDTSAPSNNTSTPAWLQSILNALGVVNNTVGGGFNLIKNTLITIISFIGDLLQRIFDTVVAGFEALIDVLERIFTSIGTTATNIVQAAEDAADSVVDGLSDGWDLITDFWEHLHEIIEWFYNHGLDSDHEWSFMVLFHYLFDFDSTTALADFQANKYGDFVLDVRDFFNTFITSIVNQNASSRVFFVIPIGTHFGSNVGDVEINFDWYSSIRDNYLPYFMAFLYISVIWLFFKRLPDILRGVAGAESSFSDSLPYDTESKTYTNSGVYTSKTHVSNGGRSRVSFNSYKKF